LCGEYATPNGKWLSLVEHLVWDQGVAGSNPVFPTMSFGALAQLGEHLLCKQGVSGSIPLGSTNLYKIIRDAKKYKKLASASFFLYLDRLARFIASGDDLGIRQ
jgi:hypothetical protein